MKLNFTKSIRVALSAFIVMFAALSLHAQYVEITAPAGVAGLYPAKPAWFQQEVTAVTADFAYPVDTSGANTGCFLITEDLTGKIALIDRGACAFVLKATNALNAGAISVVICNNDSANPDQINSMGGDDMGLINDNVVMLSFGQCETIKMGLTMGLTGGIVAPTANQTCLTATAAADGVNTAAQLTGGGGRNLFEFPDENVAAAWYTYTPAMDGLLTVSSCMGGADTRLAVGTGHCELATITVEAANDDFCDLGDGNAWASEVELLVTGGTEYYIYFDDHWDDSGFDFTVTLEALPMVGVTFTVDMQNETVDPSGVMIQYGGNIDGSDHSQVGMTDNGNGTWSTTVSWLASDSIYYLLFNGAGVLGNEESVPAECGIDVPGQSITIRGVLVNSPNPISVPVHCWNSCEPCPPPACTDPDAIICDDFEMYTLTTVSAQSAHWTPWSGTPGAGDDAVVSDAFSTSGTQSLLVSEANGDDMLLLLGDQTTGHFLLSWKMYVPAGSTGYWNTQKIEGSPGGEFGAQVEFFADGTATLDAGAADVVTHAWDADTWMNIALDIDMTNDWIVYTINGEEIYSWPASWQTFGMAGMLQLGAINFFGNTGTTQYIDDVLFKALPECPDDAVICDSYETYVAGTTTGGQSPWWSTWSGTLGGGEDGIVSDDQAFDGNNSMLINNTGAQDVLLLLGNQTSGNWSIEWQMYVPTGNVGYHNIQEDETPGVQWNMEAWFNANNAGAYTAGMGQLATGETYTTPQDSWFPVVSMIDLDNGTHTFMVDGNVVLDNVPYAGTQIGAIDFFSINGDNTAYFDAIRFRELDPIVVNNPVNVTFHVNMSNVVSLGDAHIAGEMNGWTGEPMTDDGDGTWSATYELLMGDTVEYKFQNGVDGWENNIPNDCTLGGFGNRFVVVGDMDMELDLVCFDECADCMINTDDLAFENAISVYPNPASNLTNVIYNMDQASDLMIKLSNNLGQLISVDMLMNAQNGSHEVELQNLPGGVYYLNITNGQHSKVTKLIVQ